MSTPKDRQSAKPNALKHGVLAVAAFFQEKTYESLKRFTPR